MESGISFNILEEVCASTPNGHHYLLLHARDVRNGKDVWAVGDEQICAVTRADFLRDPSLSYNDVLIQDFTYSDTSPESVGEWRTLIEQLVRLTLQKYIEHDGVVRVYPQWLPEDVKLPVDMSDLFKAGAVDHIILYENFMMEIVPRPADTSPNTTDR